jgi:hypothetical protein
VNRVIIRPKVRRKIGAAGLSRSGLLRLFTWLYDELEHRADKYHHNRVPGKPDQFQVRKTLFDTGIVYKFVFAVDDRQLGQLFVDDCRHGT